MATPHEPPTPRSGLTDAQRWTLGGIGALVVLLLAVVSILAADGDEDDEAAGPTTTAPASTTSTEATTTSAPEETTTTTFEPDVDPFSVAFPSPEGSRRFEAPAAAARAFATDVLGFTELVLDSPSTGDGDRAEVAVAATEDGPQTIVDLVRAGDAWFVTGSRTADVVVTEPAPGTSLATPFQTAGEALAFEGTVQVLVVPQSDPVPLGEGTVTGSGTPPPGPFRGTISYAPPPAPTPGVLVFRIASPEDGRIVAATSVLVRLTNLTA